MSASLVGSEMCIRDSRRPPEKKSRAEKARLSSQHVPRARVWARRALRASSHCCLKASSACCLAPSVHSPRSSDSA
eukprot:1867949-Alexandrium_andersonii.AAC.1